jgi:hypothetical protein
MAPTANNFINMYLPSGTITMYARVRDSFGATTQDFTDTVNVRVPFGRRLLSDFWATALDKVSNAVQNQNGADTNMLSSCVAIEASKATTGGSLTSDNMTNIVDTLVSGMRQIVSSSPLSVNYVCEVAGAMSFIAGQPKYVSNTSIVPAVELLKRMLTSDKMVSVTQDCATKFYKSFDSAMSAQNLLAANLSQTSSSTVVNTVEDAGFRVMTLLAQSLIEGMRTTISVDETTSVVSRQLASVPKSQTYTSQTSTLGEKTFSVSLPNMAQLLNLSPSALLDTVLQFSENPPSIPGATILSMGVGISVAKDGTELAVSGLAQPINFTIPLLKEADPAPSGLVLKCKVATSCKYAADAYECLVLTLVSQIHAPTGMVAATRAMDAMPF